MRATFIATSLNSPRVSHFQPRLYLPLALFREAIRQSVLLLCPVIRAFRVLFLLRGPEEEYSTLTYPC